MNELIEVFPFAFGVLLGVTWFRLGGPRTWYGPWGVGCVALGAFATLATGEWRESALYFLFDIGLVAVVSAATTIAAAYWLRRRERNPRV
jgi:hypothetical protein